MLTQSYPGKLCLCYSELAGTHRSLISLFLSFEELPYSFPQWLSTVTLLTMYENSTLPICCQHLLVWGLVTSSILTGVIRQSHCDHNQMSILSIVTCFWIFCESYFEKHLFSNSHYQNTSHVSWFYLSSLTLEMNLLSDECFENIFSNSVGCPQTINPLLSVGNIFLVDISFWETCIGVVSFVVVVSPYLGS